MGEWFLSRRDGTIVARHEVPWNHQEKSSRPSGTIEQGDGGVGLTMTSTVPPGREPLCMPT
jgi:hypothetical protein